MDTESLEVYRSREVVEDDELQTLLNSLTLDQIRSAISQLSPTKKIAMKAHRDAAEALSRTGQTVQSICNALLSVEAGAPFKRCLFTRTLGDVNVTGLDGMAGSDLRSAAFSLRVALVQQLPNCLSITLEHTVTVEEWIRNGSTKTIETSRVRHPIIVRLYAHQNIAAFFYPGFGQGVSKSTAVSYQEVMADAMAFIGPRLGISFTPLPSRECIKVLLEGANSRVRVVQSDVDATSGKVSLNAMKQHKSVEEVLVDYLSLGGDLGPELRAQILERGRKALGTYIADSITLFWFDEQVVTRLHFWGIGTDMWFVWHGVPNSFRIVEEIVGLFRTTYEMLPAPGSDENALQWLSKVQPGEIVRPAEFAARFALTVQQSRDDLLGAMKVGLVQPVYRLRTTVFLLETQNNWTPDPISLNKEFEDEHGGSVDGRDPRNVEVAFMRLGVVA